MSLAILKDWAEDDRPREKLINSGPRGLSNAELLAIILGSGSRNETALALAQRVLQDSQSNWDRLGQQSIEQLQQFEGIGPVKAATITACLEIGRRKKGEPIKQQEIKSSTQAHQLVRSKFEDLSHEEFWVIYLDRGNHVITTWRASQGGVSGTVIDARMLLKKAIELMASGIILTHNHPSGRLVPSTSDKTLTKRVAKAARLVDVKVLDHLIIHGSQYMSFADEQLMPE